MSADIVLRVVAAFAARVAKDSDVSPGVIGFVVVALLGVATWLLLRSMIRQIKKIDLPDDETPAGPDPSPDARHEDRGSADG